MNQIRVVALAVHYKSHVTDFPDVRKTCHGKLCHVLLVQPVVQCRSYIFMPECVSKYSRKGFTFLAGASFISR
uniref:Uncharacterized protein n=1 Tax=Rhizophora mucronata TaxID=61149 RepID=A0A2P2IZT8_RHIMU